MSTQPKHTPGPWKVMPCPQHAGKHPSHDHRWIVTADAEIEQGYDPRSWGLSSGSLICEMRDGPPANARLIAAAPDLLVSLSRVVTWAETYARQNGLDLHASDGPLASDIHEARAAIAKAKGGDVA